MASELVLAAGGIGLFVLGTLFGMAMQRTSHKDAMEETDEDQSDLTDWEGNQ